MGREVTMRRVSWLLAMMVLVQGAGALAQSQQPLTRKQIIDTADKNRDGRIGRVEFLERMNEAFFFLDADRDGYLIIVEYQRIQGADPRRFAGADRNNDGKLSIDELLKSISEDFDAADTNNDGVIAEEEITVWIRR
jgi:Ca2+-binding EF-hand superfamily protein